MLSERELSSNLAPTPFTLNVVRLLSHRTCWTGKGRLVLKQRQHASGPTWSAR